MLTPRHPNSTMQKSNQPANWITLTPCPLHKFCKPILFGNDEGIIVTPYGKCNSIQIYHINENKWTEFIRFRTQIEMRYNTISLNPISNITIYLYDGKQYELDSENQALIKMENQQFHLEFKNKKNAYVESCITNKEFHIIGGSKSLTHLSYNVITDSVTKHTFYCDNNIINGKSTHKPMIKGFALIGLQSQNRIIMLGGRDDSKFRGYLRNISIGKLSENNENNTFIWSKSEYTMPHAMSDFGCILTDDEKHIIIFGGKTKSSGLIDEIGILNIETWKWIKSDIKCPKKSKYFAVKTRFSDDIHLFDDTGNHFKMHLSNIMSNKYQITLARVQSKGILLNGNSHSSNKHTKIKYEWKKCKNVPYSGFCRPVVTSDGSIIISPYNQQHLIVYDNADKNWKTYTKYFANNKTENHTISLHLKCEKLYLFDGNFSEYNLQSKTCRRYGKIADIGANPVSIILQDTLHVIGGFKNCKHLSWENSSKCFIEHKINEGPEYNIIQGQGVIALEKCKQILMFGGNEGNIWNGYMNTMWLCNMDETNNYKWKRLLCTMPNPMYRFGYIKTKNERYVITFGGRTEDGLMDDIYILNLLNFEWSKGGKCPKKGMYHSVLVGNDIHLFEIDSNKHWKLDLYSIINPLENNEKRTNGLHFRAHSALLIGNGMECKEEELPEEQLVLSQQILIKALKMELQQMKTKLLQSENDRKVLCNENERLKAENVSLRDNMRQSLEKIMSVNKLGNSNRVQRFSGSSHRMLRKLQRSDTFLLLTDDDFETDEEFDEEEDDDENATDHEIDEENGD